MYKMYMSDIMQKYSIYKVIDKIVYNKINRPLSSIHYSQSVRGCIYFKYNKS